MNPIWAHGVTVAVQGHMEEASRWMMADPTKAQMHVQTAQSIQNTTMGMVNYLLVQQAQSSTAMPAQSSSAQRGLSSASVPFHGQSSHHAPSLSYGAFDPWEQATWRREVQMPCDDASLQVPAAKVDDPQPAMLPQNDAEPDEDGCIETPIPPRPPATPDHPQPATLPQNDADPTDDEFDEIPMPPRPPDGYVAPTCDEPNCNNISAWECSTKKCKLHCGVTSNP